MFVGDRHVDRHTKANQVALNVQNHQVDDFLAVGWRDLAIVDGQQSARSLSAIVEHGEHGPHLFGGRLAGGIGAGGHIGIGIGRGLEGAGTGLYHWCVVGNGHKGVDHAKLAHVFGEDVGTLVGVVFTGNDVQQHVGPIITGLNGRFIQPPPDRLVWFTVQGAVGFNENGDFQNTQTGDGHIPVDAQLLTRFQVHDKDADHAPKTFGNPQQRCLQRGHVETGLLHIDHQQLYLAIGGPIERRFQQGQTGFQVGHVAGPARLKGVGIQRNGGGLGRVVQDAADAQQPVGRCFTIVAGTQFYLGSGEGLAQQMFDEALPHVALTLLHHGFLQHALDVDLEANVLGQHVERFGAVVETNGAVVNGRNPLCCLCYR